MIDDEHLLAPPQSHSRRSSRRSSRRPSTPSERHVNTHGVFGLYARFFKCTRWFGVYPCYYDGTEKFEVKMAGFGWARLWWILNIIYVAIYFAKVNILLAINHHTNYKYQTLRNSHMFQLQFVTGVGLVSSLFFTQSAKMKDVATTMTMWLKLEKTVAKIPEPPEVTHKRHRFLKIQYGLYMGTLISSCFTLNGMGFGAPIFPVFLSSAIIGFNRAVDPSYRYYNVSSVWEGLAKGLAQFGEAYTGIIGWEVIGSFDVLISMMCRTVCHALDKLTEMVRAEGLGALHRTELYHSCRIFVMQMGNVFGRVLFIQELFNMGVGVLLFYGALTERELVYLMAFFVTNGVALTVRIYLLYLPMVNVYNKSTKFKKFVARKLNESKLSTAEVGEGAGVSLNVPGTAAGAGGGSGAGGAPDHSGARLRTFDRKLLERKAAAFRYMVFRPWGFHRITTKSIADYILAMFSYIVTLKAR